MSPSDRWVELRSDLFITSRFGTVKLNRDEPCRRTVPTVPPNRAICHWHGWLHAGTVGFMVHVRCQNASDLNCKIAMKSFPGACGNGFSCHKSPRWPLARLRMPQWKIRMFYIIRCIQCDRKRSISGFACQHYFGDLKFVIERKQRSEEF